jgi:hypothetical protein
MKFWLPFIVMIALLTGCTTTTPQPYKPTTYNVASAKKGNQKSTVTYPGSDGAAPNIQTQATPSSQQPKPESTEPYAPMSITSTTLAMATPTPESVEQPSEAAPSGTEESSAEGMLSVAAPMPKPLNDDSTMIKVAVLIPQKTIKKYAISTVNSVMSYLLYKNYYFDLNVFNSGDEKEESIAKALNDIKAGGYQYIIAPVTNEGALVIANRVQDTLVFIPTLQRSSVAISNSNIVFGGIDYDRQIALLSEKANERVGTFEDGSSLSYQLNALVKQHSNRVFYEKRVENSKANFKGMFKGNGSLNKASLYLNTPIVTSSLIASQLRANDLHPYVLLSSQINYNPLILTLTQYEDRDNLYIASSIQRAPTGLEEINAMFGHDIVYDWVNYSTSIGADFVCSNFFNGRVPRIFTQSVDNNQVVYATSLYQAGRNEFIRLRP